MPLSNGVSIVDQVDHSWPSKRIACWMPSLVDQVGGRW